MRPDRGDRSRDVGQPLTRRGGSQRNQFSEHVAPHAGLEISGRHQINPRTKEFFKFCRETAQLEQAHAGPQRDQQVNVTIGAILATGDAAEHTADGHAVGCSGTQHRDPIAAQPTTQRTYQPT